MSEAQRSTLAGVVIPFIIFTGIWGSTWIVIRDQLGTVPPQWSVAYRFFIAAAAMALAARIKGHRLRLGPEAILPILAIGIPQVCITFHRVYLAERHIPSGIVATVFALLLIPRPMATSGIRVTAPRRVVLTGASPSCAALRSTSFGNSPAARSQ